MNYLALGIQISTLEGTSNIVGRIPGRVDEPTIAALRRLRETGRRLVLVTARELDELLAILPERPILRKNLIRVNNVAG